MRGSLGYSQLLSTKSCRPFGGGIWGTSRAKESRKATAITELSPRGSLLFPALNKFAALLGGKSRVCVFPAYPSAVLLSRHIVPSPDIRMKSSPPIVSPRISRPKLLKSMGFAAPFLFRSEPLFGPSVLFAAPADPTIERQSFHLQTIACFRTIQFNLLSQTC